VGVRATVAVGAAVEEPEADGAGSSAVLATPRFTIVLDTVLTAELVAEGLARDVVRRVQMLRKDRGLELDDRIVLLWDTDSDELGVELSEVGVNGSPTQVVKIFKPKVARKCEKVLAKDEAPAPIEAWRL